MKTFIELLSEAKDRFFLKNKNLTPEQQQYFIDATKKYKNFETMVNNNIGWHKVHKADYDTLKWWLDASQNTKSAKKRKAKKLRHKGISGLTEGEDYINIKTKKTLSRVCPYSIFDVFFIIIDFLDKLFLHFLNKFYRLPF